LGSGDFSWGPSNEALASFFAEWRKARDNESQESVADALGTTSNTIGSYESEKSGRRFNAIRYLRFLVETRPKCALEAARLIGVPLKEEDMEDPELDRYVKQMRELWDDVDYRQDIRLAMQLIFGRAEREKGAARS